MSLLEDNQKQAWKSLKQLKKTPEFVENSQENSIVGPPNYPQGKGGKISFKPLVPGFYLTTSLKGELVGLQKKKFYLHAKPLKVFWLANLVIMLGLFLGPIVP